MYRSMYVWVFVWLPSTGSLLFNQNWKSYFITKQPIEDGVSFLHKLEEIQNNNLGIEGIQNVHWHEIISYWRHFGFNLERLLRASSIWLKAELRVRLHKPPLFRAALSARKSQRRPPASIIHKWCPRISHLPSLPLEDCLFFSQKPFLTLPFFYCQIIEQVNVFCTFIYIRINFIYSPINLPFVNLIHSPLNNKPEKVKEMVSSFVYEHT